MPGASLIWWKDSPSCTSSLAREARVRRWKVRWYQSGVLFQGSPSTFHLKTAAGSTGDTRENRSLINPAPSRFDTARSSSNNEHFSSEFVRRQSDSEVKRYIHSMGKDKKRKVVIVMQVSREDFSRAGKNCADFCVDEPCHGFQREFNDVERFQWLSKSWVFFVMFFVLLYTVEYCWTLLNVICQIIISKWTLLHC